MVQRSCGRRGRFPDINRTYQAPGFYSYVKGSEAKARYLDIEHVRTLVIAEPRRD